LSLVASLLICDIIILASNSSILSLNGAQKKIYLFINNLFKT